MMVRPQAYFVASNYRTSLSVLQDNCSHTTLIEDACAIIVQAAAFAAAKILHKGAKNGQDADDARSVSAAAAAVELAAQSTIN
jgi:hypothetical protein